MSKKNDLLTIFPYYAIINSVVIEILKHENQGKPRIPTHITRTRNITQIKR